jgi:diguanylate cyclase (GGDEF)-like protein/PAS domain S-box-containing protein
VAGPHLVPALDLTAAVAEVSTRETRVAEVTVLVAVHSCGGESEGVPAVGAEPPIPSDVISSEVAQALLSAHAPVIVALVDRDERLVELGGALLSDKPHWLDHLGEQLGELVGDDLVRLNRSALNGDAVHGVAVLDGRPWLVAASPVRSGDGQVTGSLYLLTYADVAGVQQELTAAAAANERFRAVVELSRDFIAIAELDGTIDYVNRAGRDLVGLDDDEAVGRPAGDFFTEEAVLDGSGKFSQSLRSDGFWEGRSTLRHFRTGEAIPVSVNAFLATRSSDGRRLGLATVMRDLRAQLRAESDMQARIAEQRAVADLGRAALTVPLLDLLEEAVGVVAARFPSMMVAVLRRSLAGDSIETAATSRPDLDAVVVPVDRTTLSGRAFVEGRLQCTDDVVDDARLPDDGTTSGLGVRSALSCPILGGDQPWGVIGIAGLEPRHWSDDDQALVEAVAATLAAAVRRQELESQLQHQALHDPLTGLPNRALVTDRIQHALGQAVRRGTVLAVLLLDLDDFKMVNDTLGHGQGDDLLAELALRFEKVVREGDTVARLGGDEFVVLCEDLGSEHEVGFVAEALLEACKADVQLSDRRVSVSVSIGVALAFSGEASTSALLSEADMAMYRAKRDRPGTYRIFDEAMRGEVLGRVNIAGQLRNAVRADELEVVYQPIVDLRTGQVRALEALARWTDESGLAVPPDVFIPVAEETGLIGELGAAVLRRAVHEAASWQDVAAVGVRVNTSAHELRSRSLFDQVTRTLEEEGLPVRQLGLEITESMLVDDDAATQDNLSRLRDAGIALLVDDFGTGFSSLSYLQRFPVVDVLKIDRSFLAEGTRGQAVVEAVVALGRAFDLSVCAEGVETVEQHALVTHLGCDFAQGYLLGRPVPGAQVRELLAQWQPVLR